ncbi:MAG: calcium-binding protein [Pikeienuella sp.]
MTKVTFSMTPNYVVEKPASKITFNFDLDKAPPAGEYVSVWLYASTGKNAPVSAALHGGRHLADFDLNALLLDEDAVKGIDLFSYVYDVSVEAGVSDNLTFHVIELRLTKKHNTVTLKGFDDGGGYDDAPRSYYWNIAADPNENPGVEIINNSILFTEYTAPGDVPGNQAPRAKDDTASTAAGVPVTIDVLKNDSDGNGDTLIFDTFSDPANGSIKVVNGKVVYTPAAGFSGGHSFSYTVSDGRGGTDSATVRVAVGGGAGGAGVEGKSITGNNAPNWLVGAAGDDTIKGLGGADTLKGEGGNDRLDGGSGHDKVYGGVGDDTLIGQAGNDRMEGGRGRDRLFAGGDNDQLYGGDDGDLLDAGGGRDRLYGGNGNDTMKGGADNDSLEGGGGKDLMKGQMGDDTLKGGGGNDKLVGNGGKDLLKGQAGNDHIKGGGGDDTLAGNGGADRLEGGRGDDLLKGGGGADVFVFGRNDGKDVIRGFQEIDSIEIRNGAHSFAQLDISQTGKGALVEFGQTSILLQGVNANRLDADDFIF